MDFTKFPINQSLIRKYLHNGEERVFCHRNIYLTSIKRSIRGEATMPMLYGKYFESKALGQTAKGEKPVLDLPRKKLTKAIKAENAVREAEGKPLILGEKFKDHERVDDQVNRFKALVNAKRIIVTDANVQVPIKVRWEKDPDVMLQGELDIFPTTILVADELKAAIIDLKLTANIHSTFGEYCYGSPEYLDLIQAKMYHYLVRRADINLNPHLDQLITSSVKKLIEQNNVLFMLWIFNYKGDVLEDKFINVKWDGGKQAELHESIRKTIALIEDGEAQDWPTNPVYSLCKNCPWKECPDRDQIQTV